MNQILRNNLVYSLLLGCGLAFQPALGMASSFQSGEFMIVGFKGDALLPEQLSHFQKIKPRGFILFSRNITNPQKTAQLVKAVKSLNTSPTENLIAVDQEGGLVQRVKGWVTLPSARAIGQSGDAQLTYQLGVETGKILKSLGINMNLAPVLDLGQQASSDFMRSRTYGRNPASVGMHGVHFSRGLLSQGVLPVAKHFPGLGKAKSDPHLSTPIVHLSPHEWTLKLEPFQAFSQLSPSGMMVSHAIYSPQDPSGHPATFSSFIHKTLLRSQLKYDGIVITDDLLMAGATQHRDLGRAAVDALKAGADLVLVSWGLKQQRLIAKAIDRAIMSGEISEDQLRMKRVRISNALRALQSSSREPAAEMGPQFETPKLLQLVEESYTKSVALTLAGQNLRIERFVCEKASTCLWIKQNTSARVSDVIPQRSTYTFIAESMTSANAALHGKRKPAAVIFMSHHEFAAQTTIPVINLYGRQKTGLKVAIEALMKGPSSN
ncbi:MAG: glycoside hydrolase family 3 N-terminal domain-containing protein [Pseudobdellovibrionaceae bacterium]